MTDEDPTMYDAFAQEYADHIRDSPYNAYYDRPGLTALLGDVTGHRLLDAGCGPGVFAAQLREQGAIVTAFDESREMVRLAQQRLGDESVVRRASLEQPLTWLPDRAFDTILMSLVLHYVDDRVSALGELHRVLDHDGRLVLSIHHPTGELIIRGGSYFTAEFVEETWKDNWRVRYWRQPLQAWCDEFSDAGFVIERLVELRPSPEMADRHPEDFHRLTVDPAFIAFRLKKA